MLSLERALTVDGLTVFRDHADPNQFWVLPGPVALARRDGDNQPAISVLKYKPAVADGSVKGGGFAMLETTLQLSREREARIRAAVSAQPGVTDPVVAVVPFETGTVQCIALNLQGSGGAVARPAPAGAFNAVEEILGAATPSLDAQNRAAFSLTLSQEGATILAQAFADGLAPIGVVYSLTYSALRPAINVEIKADYERIFQQFSASLEGQYMFFRAGIDAAFEQLKQSGAIDIKVIDFTGEQDEKDKEKWALDFFRDQLLADWFEPTLTPGKIAGEPAHADALSEVISLGRSMLDGPPAAGGQTQPGAAPPRPGGPTGGGATGPATGRGTTGPATGSGTTGPATGGGTTSAPAAGQPPARGPAMPGMPGGPRPAGGPGSLPPGPVVTPGRPGIPPINPGVPPVGPATAARPPAVLTPDAGNAPLLPGRSVTHVPSPAGLSETVMISGEGAVVTVDRTPAVLGPGGVLVVETPPGPGRTIEVTWPAGGREETFHLFFDFDKPDAAGWSTNPPSPAYRAYAADNSASDTRFMTASGVSDGAPAGGARPWPGPERGEDRLTAWLQGLAAPRQVTIDAHASFETSPQPGSGATILPEAEQRDHNMRLSMRRADVATGICGRAGVTLSVPARSHGDQEGRGNPANPAVGDPNERVARITGRIPGAPAGSWRGTLSRAAVSPPVPPPPVNPPVPPPAGPPVAPPVTPPAPPARPTTTAAAVSLKLRFVRQEERKKMVFRYNRAEAVKRVYAPQGFIGLMLADIEDAGRFLSEIDLDDPFFRKLDIVAEAPGDFGRIGLLTAQAAIRYGDADDTAGIKMHDFLFRRSDQGPRTHSFFLSEDHALDYRLTREFHFDPASDWDAPQHHYVIPETSTSDRTLLVSPADILDFVEISVEAGDIDAGIVERIEATATLDDGAGFARSSVFNVLPGSAPQVWRVRAPRTPGGQPRPPLTYTLRHHLKQGMTRDEGPFETTARRIIVHDCFPTALEILLLPLFGSDIVQAFAEISYEDPDNAYVRNERVEARAGQTANVPVRIALMNPERLAFSVRYTFVGANGSVTTGAAFEPDGAIVPWKPA